MIEILNVSKKFRIWEDRSRDLKETAINLLKGKRRSYRDLWALREINVEIREGETVAFIGENGSGKSTLLKLLCGIYVPDEGEIIADGKISALLELGVGFHPDLTGEENIYLNGAMLGFNRREMKKRFDGIVSFSEIGDFVYSPIRTYSSGMTMRLGFSIAMCVDPDILLIDEVLAVGDEAFQQKCIKRLEEFKESGKTIILVSHGLDLVKQFCKRVILLYEGRMMIDDIPEKTIDAYHALLSLKTGGSEFQMAGIDGEGENVEISIGEGKVALKADEQVEPIVVEERFSDEEVEVELNQERVRIIEVQDAQFFAGKIFLEAFGQTAPVTPRNYVAIYRDLKEPSAFHIIGYIHIEIINETGFVGGLCVDPGWRDKGLGKILLNSVDHKNDGLKALFVYTNDSRLAGECGYEVLSHPYLMVKWLKPLSLAKKKRFIDAAMAIGPF